MFVLFRLSCRQLQRLNFLDTIVPILTKPLSVPLFLQPVCEGTHLWLGVPFVKLPKLTAVIEREEDWFVATCPELGVASQGRTITEAEKMISKKRLSCCSRMLTKKK